MVDLPQLESYGNDQVISNALQKIIDKKWKSDIKKFKVLGIEPQLINNQIIHNSITEENFHRQLSDSDSCEEETQLDINKA